MVHIQAIQTVMPSKPTDPRQSIKLILPNNLNPTSYCQRRFNIVLCYNKAGDEDSGWVVAGWIKESLGRALSEEPIFAGRLRWNDECGGEWYIVMNDSGVRLVEGRSDLQLSDFLGLEGNGEIESELVFWEDVKEQEPQFSPLFYVQVTNFSCGGYSIGISCLVILADPYVLTSFIKKWTNLHNSIVSQTNILKIPIFYLPNLRKPDASPPLLIRSNTTKTAAKTIIFNIPTKILDSDKNLAELYIVEAENKVGRRMASKFSLFVKKENEDVKVEICSREGISEKRLSINGLSCASLWDEMELSKICFHEGNQAAYGSCWINSIVDEGSIMILELENNVNTLGMKIIVTFT